MLFRNPSQALLAWFLIVAQVKLQDIGLLSRSLLDLTLSAEVKYRTVSPLLPLEKSTPKICTLQVAFSKVQPCSGINFFSYLK
jgi:hypothetical protein